MFPFGKDTTSAFVRADENAGNNKIVSGLEITVSGTKMIAKIAYSANYLEIHTLHVV